MIKKYKLLLLFFICVTTVVMAQKPTFHSLNSNATLIEYHKNNVKQNNHIQLNNRTQSTSTLALSLPFYDDFSYAGPFPDSSKWKNSQSVFVNHTKAIAPPTLGVATFDGLNQYGYPYNSAIASNTANSLPSVASDTLTSASIRLDSISSIQIGLTPADSVYLSFYYQGMGYWEKPEQGDYLNLDLYNKKDSSWTQIWSLGGYLYAPDSAWHLVMIPITDTSYFNNDFRFRFRNLSGACGDVDHWHIDAVYLDRHRTSQDTMFSTVGSAFNDVSFVYDLISPLKNYRQMPYKQYRGASDMRDSIGTCLRSNFSNPVSVHTNYSFYNKSGTALNFTPNGSNNLSPYNSVGYCNDVHIVKPPLNGFTYPLSLSDSTFTMKFFIDKQGTADLNDTITFHQKFSNYYAYDDGSAEVGIGIGSVNGVGNYKTAARFTLNVADTLRAMDIFFNPVIDVDLIKNSPFTINVWADNAGAPSNIIYTDTTRRSPYFPINGPVNGLTQRENGFLRYQFSKPVYLDSNSTFYVGINQIYPAPAITIGFDKNTDFHKNMFYNSDGTHWYVFPGDLDPDYRGSLMIHPVFGDSLQTVSIETHQVKNSTNIAIYPNPATDEVFIQSENIISKILVTDLLGNIIIQQNDNSIKKLNTLSLQSGVYLLKTFTNKGFADTQKLIIAK